LYYILVALLVGLYYAWSTTSESAFVLLLILIFCTLVLMLAFSKNPRYSVKAHWHHYFDGTYFPASAFYELVKKGLDDRRVPEISVALEYLFETHALSAKREYLKISEDEFFYYVCAAPFGRGTFVSWRLCEYDERLIARIPILNKLAGKDRKRKSFYQTDTEAMYKSAIHATVLGTIDAIGTEKGLRSLSELERQYGEVR